MPINKKQKSLILNFFEEQKQKQKTFVLLTTEGAKESTTSSVNFAFRKALREGESPVKIQIVKNTLVRNIFGVQNLRGQTYVAFLTDPSQSTDEVQAPKNVVNTINKSFKSNFDIIGSVVNGEFLDKENTIQLSNTPSFKESMSMVGGTINQIISSIAVGVKEVPSGIARGVSEYSKTIKK